MFRTNFLSADEAHDLITEHGAPLFVYSRAVLARQAQMMLAVPALYGLTIRYAMKANSNSNLLAALKEQGIKIDASSGYEAAYAITQGFAPQDILLTSQQLAHNLNELVTQGVQFNATSLRQLEEYGKLFPGGDVSVRINPGVGSGHSNRTNVGGVSSSFGIWHEYIPAVHELADKYRLRITRVHTHIGSGTDPAVWRQASQTSVELVKLFPDATILDLGGGFKVGRLDTELDNEKSAGMTAIGKVIAEQVEVFHRETGRKLHLELEPGTFLVANAGVLLARVDDIVDTGTDGYSFLKLNTGMNDIMRPSLYGAQHPIAVLNDAAEQQEYVVVGHNCESGDILTPAPGDPEALWPRILNKAAVGDIVIIGGTGAYCASMAAHGYNGFPDAAEILV
jgi:diaminopimelate decarboxylase